MNDENFDIDQFLDLVDRFINGWLTDAQFAKLSETLEQVPKARVAYIDYMNLHGELIRNFKLHGNDQAVAVAEELEELLSLSDSAGKVPSNSKSAGAIPSLETPDSRSVDGVGTLFGGWAAGHWLTLGLLFFAIGWAAFEFGKDAGLWDRSEGNLVARNSNAENNGDVSGANTQTLEELTIEKNAVAILTREVDAKWSTGETSYKQGQAIAPGMLILDSGLVQIDFYCGATMILEGPARFEIKDSDLGYAHSGKLRVFVPERATGFVIQSKECNVLDLGTEFAMSVDATSGSEVHVIDGEVKVTGTERGSEKEEFLTTGKAVRYSTADQVTAIVTEQHRFVGPTELAKIQRDLEQKGIERWLQSSSKNQEDSNLIVQYTFQDSSDWDRSLIDSSPDSTGSSNGAIVGCEWTQGRWDSKRALQFSKPSHRVRMDVPGTFDAITLTAWVNLDVVGLRNMALVHPDTSQDHFLHWTLDASEYRNYMSLHFSVTDIVDGEPVREHFNSTGFGDKFPLTLVDQGKWMHVAVTYDPQRMLVTHYKNGEVVGTDSIERKQKVGLGICNLGNWPYKPWAKGTEFEVRNLMGKIDEFAAFSRVLDANEIRQMYEAGCPDQ